jgi:DNA replication protein DnaC
MGVGENSWSKLPSIDVLTLDDWFRDPLTTYETRNILEVFDDRWQRGALILVSQVPKENWYPRMEDPTLADAVLDRVVHNSYNIELKGESQRKMKSKNVSQGVS